MYNTRSNGYLSIEYLKAILDRTKNIETEIGKCESDKFFKHIKKYCIFIEHNI